MFRSSHRGRSVGKCVLENSTKIHRKTPGPETVFNKVAGLRPETLFKKGSGLRPGTLLKKKFWYRYFPVTFVKFLRTPFL